jgi:hypothetical protein
MKIETTETTEIAGVLLKILGQVMGAEVAHRWYLQVLDRESTAKASSRQIPNA